MKYSMMPIIKASSIEKFIQSQCDTEIDLNELFWEGKPHSLETIDFSDKSIKEAKKQQSILTMTLLPTGF